MINRKMPFLAATFDLAGLSPWNPLASPAPEPGAYEATVLDVDPAYNGGKSCKFTVDLASGHTTDLYIGNESTEKKGNERKWLQALCCVAPDVEKFLANVKANPKITFDPVTTFKGKKIHVLVTEVPGVDAQNRPNLPNKEFITAAQYAQIKAAGGVKSPTPNGATAGATTQTPTTPPPPAAGGDVLKGLFG